MIQIVIVIAMADNGVIGNAGGIPWQLPDDLRRFKAATLGKPCIMGRKTWDSLPKKPLPGRRNIVVTRDSAWRAEGAETAQSLEDALAQAKSEAPAEIMVIGGAEIYREALPLASRIQLTEVHEFPDGDTRFFFDRSAWIETAREDLSTPSGQRYSFVKLERSNPSRS